MTSPPGVDTPVEDWAASGLMSLTGSAKVPLGPPELLLRGLQQLGSGFPQLDTASLMAERAALGGLTRRGTTSCGGGCRLLRTADGWIAVSLPRPDDVAAVPAWLELPAGPRDAEDTPATWDLVAHTVSARSSEWLLERGLLLQLAVASLGESRDRNGIHRVPLGPALPRSDRRGLIVIDLTSLWAGPLCGDLLARQGAMVIKVESTARPDGARRGPPAFFDLLNGAKRSVALDFGSREGAHLLQQLLSRADVVLEASRPRALEQLGISAIGLVSGGGPQVWVSITGHGRTGSGAARIAFGDDAAVAGGLVSRLGETPMFCADAIADPLAGLAAAGACLDALDAGGRWMLDVSMAGVAAGLAGPALPVPGGITVAPPRARRPVGKAPPLGDHTSQVLDEFGLYP